MKKKYNPFKMWGSYVGLGLTIIYYIMGHGFWDNKLYISELFYVFERTSEFYPIGMIFWIAIFMCGFLVGWGIHSFIRRFKK